jgi:ribosomal protein S18 acetylase RimI-like enzyme
LLGKRNRDDFVLGAFLNEKLVGVIGLKREKKHSVSHKGTVWGLVVLPECRKQGIGGKLLGSLVEKALEHEELKFIRAVVTVTDINASHVFKSQGFVQYGLEQRGIKEGTAFYDLCYLMFKLRD